MRMSCTIERHLDTIAVPMRYVLGFVCNRRGSELASVALGAARVPRLAGALSCKGHMRACIPTGPSRASSVYNASVAS